MICTQKQFIRTGADGTKWWQVVLTADADPDTLNLTGADVDNLNDELGLAAGSVLITPSSNYIAFEDGVFTLKSTSGGGGGGGDEIAIQSVEIEGLSDAELDTTLPFKYIGVEEETIYINYSVWGSIPSDTYEIVITPGANSYLWDDNASDWGAKGEAVTISYDYSGGDFEAQETVTPDPDDPSKTVYVYVRVASLS